MDSVLTTRGMDLRKRSTDKKRGALSFRQREVVELSLVMPPPEVSELTGYSLGNVHRILNTDEAIAHKQQIFDLYDESFKALYPQTIKAVKDGLESDDEKVKLNAAQIWLKAHGKFVPDREGDTNITAEQIVVQILNEARGARTKGNAV